MPARSRSPRLQPPAKPRLVSLRTMVTSGSETNRGFAGGCNLGLRDLAGIDYVALVNNDATVDPGWLAPLVDTLAADVKLGAACPKILFAGRFVEVEVSAQSHLSGGGDRRELGVRLSG